MASLNRISLIMVTSCASLALAACDGANDIASPGTGGNVIITNPPAPAPTPTPTPTPPSLVTPASGCPTIADSAGLADSGTITGPTGEWRVCTLPARLTRSSTLPKLPGVLYRLGGRVDVGNDLGATPVTGEASVTLTIEKGAIVFGGTGVSWLAVNRGNKLRAVGTASEPIIFTSRDNILGLNTNSSSGQWGGVVLLGRAQITDCAAPAAAPGTIACERQTEGAVDPALYGGATNADNSGQLSYVQIRYSGFVLSANSELQSLTLSGVGTGTTIDHIQSVNSSDDGMEAFGGVWGMKYFISVGAEDDNLDTDTGAKGSMQHVIVVQRDGIGDSIIEADTDNANDGQTPRQAMKVANATFVERSTSTSNLSAMLLRGGTDYTLANSVVISPNLTCLRISRRNTIQAANPAADEAGPPVFRSVAMQCGTPKYVGSNSVTEAEVATVFGAGSNNNSDTLVPTLTGGYINGATETAITAFDVTTLGGFFDATNYVGAVKQGATGSDAWYTGWTCNSTAADFGTGNTGACTTIPTT